MAMDEDLAAGESGKQLVVRVSGCGEDDLKRDVPSFRTVELQTNAVGTFDLGDDGGCAGDRD